MKRYVVVFVAFGLLLSTVVYAERFLKNIRVNGFLSQAFMKSSKNNFLTRSKKGSFEINELGLTLSTNLTDRLRFGMQLFSRDLGDLGNNSVVLDWAFADYRLTNWLGIRLGKVKAPLGFYNEGRDTDFLRPMAFLPQGIYTEAYRGFIVAYQGAGLYGNILMDKLGDIGYHAFIGTGNISKDETLVKHLENILNMLEPYTGITISNMSINTKLAAGGRVEWNTPLTGLRLGGSYLNYDSEFLVHPGAPNIGGLKVPGWLVLSMEYMAGNFTLAAEYSEMKTEISAFDIPEPLEKQTNQTYYVMLSYMLNNKVTLTGLVDIHYDDKDDKKGEKFVEMGLPDYMGWRKDMGLCLRYQVNKNWMLKAEWHAIDGAALYMHLYNLDGFEKKWNYFIFKTSVSF